MSAQRTRERIIDIIHKMKENTVARGCSPAEAAMFAAKVAEWVEKYQIEEAELRGAGGGASGAEVEVCQERVGTGKKVHNPGVTAVYAGLATAMACRLVLFHGKGGEATYGVIGDRGDAAYVVQIAATVLPLLDRMATDEGREHGEEKAGLVRWRNQYLAGAGGEIQRRLLAERAERSRAREEEARQEAAAGACRALVVTGETLAVAKMAAAAAHIEKVYGKTSPVRSRAQYDGTAHERGTAAGRTVGLRVGLGAREGGGG